VEAKDLKNMLSRRQVLFGSFLGLGGLACMDLLSSEARAASVTPGLLAPKPPQLPAKAKRCIFLFLEGGVSQVDTFEYKPALERYAGKQMPKVEGAVGEVATFAAAPNRVIPPVAPFRQRGHSGLWMSDLLPHLAGCADDLGFIYGIKVENNNHPPAVYHALTGSIFPGSPSVGAWTTYGLGTENQNLPGFIVLGSGSPAVGGAAIWSNGYLPAAYQGTLFRTTTPVPVVDLKPRPGMTPQQQRAELDVLRWLNQKHAEQRTLTGELEARIAAYEVAFRMQTETPELINLAGESEATHKLYGLDDPVAQTMGRQCLMARRMVERGVRFVMVMHGSTKPWDDHGDIKNRLPLHCREVDKPIAGLLKDLKSRGLLDETLVVWASEMGRTPFDNNLVTDKPGRDHNQYGLVMWMAGGNVRGGSSFGQTDDFGTRSAGETIHMRDLHATILRLMGMDQNQMTYLSQGRLKKLTDIGGNEIKGIMTL
jgi:Protein of unknown function (DUF1501)